MKTIIILTIFVTPFIAFSGTIQSTIDTVISFTPGEGQNAGQSDEFFPENIFGLPDKNATEDNPANAESEVLSLGLDGEIIVGFKNFYITDGEGPDFTIFENVFKNPLTGKYFAEPAKVAVSPDGINWYEFPFDSLTLEGCAGKTPTYGSEDPFDPEVSGGDSFDLLTLELDKAKFIKITDISRMILNNKNHPYYDGIISGFDLDAVVGLNLSEEATSIRESSNDKIKIIIHDSELKISREKNTAEMFLRIYDLTGKILFQDSTRHFIRIDMNHFENHLFFIQIIYKDKMFNKIIYNE